MTVVELTVMRICSRRVETVEGRDVSIGVDLHAGEDALIPPPQLARHREIVQCLGRSFGIHRHYRIKIVKNTPNQAPVTIKLIERSDMSAEEMRTRRSCAAVVIVGNRRERVFIGGTGGIRIFSFGSDL